MNTNRFRRLSDGALLRELAALLAHDCGLTATLLACLAEVDARRLYVPAGYPSMYAYCVGAFHMSEDAACRRIRAARAARQFPVILAAVAEGRVHLSGVLALAPHLTPENVAELLAACHPQEPGRDRAAAGQALPTAGPAAAGAGHPAERPIGGGCIRLGADGATRASADGCRRTRRPMGPGAG